MLGIIGGNFGRFLKKVSPVKAIVFDIDKTKTEVTWNEFLKNQKFIIATPNKTHFNITKRLLDNGKDVLCLKPFVLSTNEIKILFDTAKRNHCILKVGFNQRFRREIQKIKKPDYFSLYWNGQKEKIRFDDFYNVKFDLGIHLIDLVFQKCGFIKPISIYETFSEEKQIYSVDFKKGRIAVEWNIVRKNELFVKFWKKEKCFKYLERGKIENFKDIYTFRAMIQDFISAERSDDMNYLLKLTEFLTL